MRIIARNTLLAFWEKHKSAEQQLKAWYQVVQKSEWNSPNDVKIQFKSASIVSGKRIIFNIKGNDFRLIVDVEFKLKIVFIVWVGTHSAYDKLYVQEVQYDKADKNKKGS